MSRVLVARLDNDGDVLLAGPAVRAVAAGASHVTLLAGPRGEQAARLLPGVDEVLVWRAPWIDPEPAPVRAADMESLVARLAAGRFERALVLTSFHQSPLPLALLVRMAGIPFVAAISEDYPGSLLDVRHRVPDDLHEVERGLSLARAAGYAVPPGDDARLRVLEPPPLSAPVARLRPYVAVHPGASVPARAWEAERHAELVELLIAQGRRVVVTGSRAERALTARVAGPARPEVLDLGGRTSFPELAAVLAQADAVVVGNTGPAHLAAAVRTPVVSLFAPTVPAVRWRPWQVPSLLLGDQAIACSGCRARVCPVGGHPCLSTVGAAEALEALEALAPLPEAVAR